jgi:hypothetical protein
MVTRRSRRLLAGGVAVVVVLAVAVVSGWFLLRRDGRAGPPVAAPVGVRGGEAWSADRTVGVRVAPGGVSADTTVAFGTATVPAAESPLHQLVEVLHPAVDIVPDHEITAATVVFVVDPADVPLERTDAAGRPQRSIHNAGIQVLNERLGIWVDLPTRVENADRLVADAPHFSRFRTVLAKVGEFVVDAGRAVTVVVTYAMKPVDLLWNTGVSLVRTFADSLLGRFDDAKFRCAGRNRDYTVDVQDDTGQGKLDGCVVRTDGSNRLLLKNGLAVPFEFTPDGDTRGLVPRLGDGEAELLAIGLGLAGLMGGRTFVSGLDTGGFDVIGSPGFLHVEAELSWVAAAVDLAVGLLTVILPSSRSVTTSYRAVIVKMQAELAVRAGKGAVRITYRQMTEILEVTVRQTRVSPTVAGQATAYLDLLNCALTLGQQLVVEDWKDLPGKLAALVRRCLTDVLVTKVGLAELGDAVELLKLIAKDGKQIPALGQLAAIGILNAVTGRNVGRADLYVRHRLMPFVGTWDYDCGDSDTDVVVRADHTGVWKTSYPLFFTGDPQVQTDTVRFHLTVDGGRPTMVVDSVGSTNPSPTVTMRKGDRMRVALGEDGASMMLAGDGAGGVAWAFYRVITDYC